MSEQPEYIGKDEPVADAKELVLPEQALPENLLMVPASDRPFFPAQVQPLILSQDPWQETIERVLRTQHKTLGLCYIGKDPGEMIPPEQFSIIGCAAKIHNVVMEGERIQFIAQGIRRFRINSWLHKEPPLLVNVSYPESIEGYSDQVKAYAMAIINTIKELLPLNPLYNEELRHYLNRFSPNEPSALTDFAAAITSAEGSELQQILETIPVLRRMEKVLPLLKKEVEVAKLQNQISEEVNQRINQHQREFFLREQLKIIQKELGIAKDDKTSDIDEFKQRLDPMSVPEKVEKRIEEEMHKLSILETGSAEYGVTRNYLDWITSVPWGLQSEDHLDLSSARGILDQHHDGLKDVKERIVEFLAVGAYRGEISGAILLLVGPPGVGKTSIGKSIADALGRKFYRFSVGGMRDEAEIKGHRRTYIGAMPGKLIQALKEVQVVNPVIMLDEIDKIGASFQGDPASALLEVLDPEQNSDFMDHYLDVRVDLSKVLFVCTANQLDSIPGPLLDRMDTIRLAGYIGEEKLVIAKHHLWPKLLKRTGVESKRVKISDSAIKTVIEGYAREAGVRNLEKLLHRILRKVVVQLLEQDQAKISIGVKQVETYLGPPRFKKEKPMSGIGVVTGLAWTAMGGATLAIEANLIHSHNRGFKLTGKLGDVMKESAEIAYSYIAANLKKYQGDLEFFDKAFIHLHVPEGATPKDGPSAGITMAAALLSLARNRRVKPLAMTGELTLTGQVLPVGGIREKIIAARRSRIREVILPEDNRPDYEELPDYLTDSLQVHFAGHFNEVAELLFRRPGRSSN